MTIGIVIGAVVVVLAIAAIAIAKLTGGSRALREEDLKALEKRSAPEVASVLKCRAAIVALAAQPEAPLRKLVEEGVATTKKTITELDEVRARVTRNERRFAIVKTSTNQSAGVSGQAGLATSDVSAHQLEAELEADKAAAASLETELKAIATAADRVAAAAGAMPKEKKPDAEHVRALQDAADAFAEVLGLTA